MYKFEFETPYKVVDIKSTDEKLGLNFSPIIVELDNVKDLVINDNLTDDPRDGQRLMIRSINGNEVELQIITNTKDEWLPNFRIENKSLGKYDKK